MSPTVDHLTRRIASGDSEAFACFYRRYFDRMYARARRICGRDEAFCLDVVQDAMLKAMRKMRVMDTEAALGAWLDRIVQTCAIDRIRSEVRRRRREEAAVKQRGDEVVATDDAPSGIDALLGCLDAEQTRLVMQRYRFGWTLERIGRSLGLGPGAVDGRLRRAIATLRQAAREQIDET